MKKKKTISIKNATLRMIRDNLRKLLLEWGSRQLNDLFAEREKIERNNQGKIRTNTELAYEERQRIDNITNQIVKIRRIKEASICKCAICNDSNKDMTYNPIEKEWFCVDCYKINQDHYKDTDQA
jgi:hypothetical protein